MSLRQTESPSAPHLCGTFRRPVAWLVRSSRWRSPHLGTGTFNLYAFTLIGFATLDGPTEIKAHSLRWLPGGNSSQRLAATRMVTVTTLGNGAHRWPRLAAQSDRSKYLRSSQRARTLKANWSIA